MFHPWRCFLTLHHMNYQSLPVQEQHHNTPAQSSFSTFSCEKLVPGAAEFASGQALQDPDGASLEFPQTAPHNTIDSSSCTFPSSFDKFVVGATESKPSVTQQDHEVSSLDKIIDELINEFRDSSSEESITDSPRTVPHNTTSGSLQSASSIESKILIRLPPDCFQTFYIRMDRKGYFWTYPDVGGSFRSVDEADDAIKRFLDELRHGGRCKEQDVFSLGDRMMDDCKYFLDGPPIDPNLPRSKTTYHEERYLIQALLDQYNGDNNLFGDLARKLEDLVRKQMIFENLRWYYHFNFTTKQQANDGTSDRLFFAEVSPMQGVKAWEVHCCRMIKTENNDGGGHCYGCKSNGNPCMQHLNDTSAYIGGHLDGRLPFGLRFTRSDYDNEVVDDDDDEETRPVLHAWVDRILEEL